MTRRNCPRSSLFRPLSVALVAAVGLEFAQAEAPTRAPYNATTMENCSAKWEKVPAKTSDTSERYYLMPPTNTCRFKAQRLSPERQVTHEVTTRQHPRTTDVDAGESYQLEFAPKPQNFTPAQVSQFEQQARPVANKPSRFESNERQPIIQSAMGQNTIAFNASTPANQGKSELALRPGDRVVFTYIRSAKSERERYTVQVGDVLSIKVDGLPELSVAEFAVLPDGTIYAPQVGSLKVAGASVDEIVSALKQNYANLRIRDPKVTVSVNEVNDPASEFLESLSVGELGPTVAIEVPFSDTVNLPFHGEFNPRVPVSEWRAVLDAATYRKFGGALEVFVNVDRASDNNVFVIGEVADPSEISIAVADNAFSAIAAAGGFLKTAARKRLIVIRTEANGKRKIIPLNLKDLMQGKSLQSALNLRPGDILVVPPTRIAQSNTAVEQYVRNLLPFDLNLGLGIDFQND